MDSHKPIKEYAKEILRDWKRPAIPAKIYLDAMLEIDQADDDYIFEKGAGILAYFLANAESWRGETARKIKKELNKIVNDYYT